MSGSSGEDRDTRAEAARAHDKHGTNRPEHHQSKGGRDHGLERTLVNEGEEARHAGQGKGEEGHG